MKDLRADVFISYRREDGAVFTDALASSLTAQGFTVFFDKKALRSGSRFPEEIASAIESSNEFIAVVTPSYLSSDKSGVRRIAAEEDWVRKELVIALASERAFIHPVVVDCDFPNRADVPSEIAPFLDINYRRYDARYDTVDAVAETLKEGFHQETLENALVGSIVGELEGVDPNDGLQFNVACKALSRFIQVDEDCKALLHILDSIDEMGGHRYRRDYRFAAFYTLFSYYRRNHRAMELVSFVAAREGEFGDYRFFNYSLTEYYTLKADLSETRAEREECLRRAVECARRASDLLPDNDGVLHSFCISVAAALENDVDVIGEDVDRALLLSARLVKGNFSYARYHSTRARLLAQARRYDEALSSIRRAAVLEVPEHEDWSLRVAGYYRDEMVIRLKMLQGGAEGVGGLAEE